MTTAPCGFTLDGTPTTTHTPPPHTTQGINNIDASALVDDSLVSVRTSAPAASPTPAPTKYQCGSNGTMYNFNDYKKVLDFSAPYGAAAYTSGYYKPDPSATECYILDLAPVGSHTALIPEAGDAVNLDAATYVVDGQSGDVAFPYVDMKVLATVGEYDKVSQVVVGVPDGMGAYLADDATVRLIVQSESYGPITGYESYPWPVNADAAGGGASYTGSHVQYVDYDRDTLRTFMDNDDSAEGMVKGMGELITTAYNLNGDLVRARNGTDRTPVGAHFSNTDKDGNYAMSKPPSYADWLMQSLCSSHLEEKYQWGPGIGLADRLYITNEEWMAYASTATAVVGLSAHAVDPSTQTAWALGVTTQGGFEKIVEVSTGETDYVAFAVSGYNGAFSGLNKTAITSRRNKQYTRSDGNDYVWPQNIVPARIYLGKKGYDEQGNACTDFLCRNGLRYGQLYGFAANASAVAWRDTWHKANYKGATVEGGFYPINWTWTGEVKDFEHDGSWDVQDDPMYAPDDYKFWTAYGSDTSGKKTEHISPAMRSDTDSAFTQTSTAGYFGDYILTNMVRHPWGEGQGEGQGEGGNKGSKGRDGKGRGREGPGGVEHARPPDNVVVGSRPSARTRSSPRPPPPLTPSASNPPPPPC